MNVPQPDATNWTYTSYEKIPETFSKWNLAESDYRAFKKTDWAVTEKIHGANFCVTTDGDRVQFAKRQEILPPDEDFFGFHSLAPDLILQVKEIFRILQAETQQSIVVSVYGELFGGEYPHPAVLAAPNVQAVQTGIYYSPKIEYCAFDIAIEDKNNCTRRYCDFDRALQIFHQVGLLCAEPLFMGKYEKAVNYKIDFESTIPTLLGLPKLPFPNKAEGVVIKPVKLISIETSNGKNRPILKKKIAEFAEDRRFHQATKWNLSKTPIFSEEEQAESWLREAMMALVVETRLNNAISKIGRVSQHDIKGRQRLLEVFASDVLDAFNEEWASLLNALPREKQQHLLEQLYRESRKLLENYFNQ